MFKYAWPHRLITALQNAKINKNLNLTKKYFNNFGCKLRDILKKERYPALLTLLWYGVCIVKLQM
jgi:hypothetical protein